MFKYNFKYELKLLLRSNWIQLLSVLLLVLYAFAAFNGQQKVKKRASDIDAAKAEMLENDQNMYKLIDSVEQGMSVSAARWTIPTNPMAVGNYYPRVAAMEVQPMAFIATGQADIFTHYVKPTASGDDFALNFTEMTSPVQLLFGSFDLAFVIVYLLPLLIIAFSYDVLSAEKESGSLRLLAAQPIGIRRWVLQKLAIRFFWLTILIALTTLLMFVFTGADIISHYTYFFGLLGLTIGYMLFWFALAFLINLWVGQSAKNAVSMLGLWVLFVLLVPSVLNQLSTTVYPMPSRTLMINEMRTLKANVAKKQDEILDNYLRDHPEYALNDTTQTRGFYHRYMASQQLIRDELGPLVNSYEDQLQKQQQWIGRFKWSSPAIIVQESLNKMAGTSSSDYESFRNQVVSFASSWRDHLMPFLFNNKEFGKEDVAGLPEFQYQTQKRSSPETLILLMIALGLIGVGFFRSKSSRLLFDGES